MLRAGFEVKKTLDTALLPTGHRAVGGGCQKDMTSTDLPAGPWHWRLPDPLSCSWNLYLLAFLLPEAAPRIQPWNRNMVLKLSGWVRNWTLLRSLYKLSRFWQVGTEINSSYSCSRQASCKFLCLLNLPPTNLGWPASFFGLSLPSVYWAVGGGRVSFRIITRQLQGGSEATRVHVLRLTGQWIMLVLCLPS